MQNDFLIHGCAGHKTPLPLSTLQDIIDDYKKKYHADAYNTIKTFRSIGDCVFGAHNDDYTSVQTLTPSHRGEHQRRLATKDLLSFLREVEAIIASGKHLGLTFDELWQLIGSLPHKGIGPVTIYDTALHISIFLGLPGPIYVYLHSENGPLKGAKGYFQHKGITQVSTPYGIVAVNKLRPGCRIDISNFPEMVAAGLDAKHIENLLCIYHEALSKLPSAKP